MLPFVLASILAGCVATGVKYGEYPASTESAGADSAKLTIFRMAASVQYSARAATLKIDGNQGCTLRLGGFCTVSVALGTHIVAVDMWDAPGVCELPIDVVAGQTYFFEVAPRTSSFLAGLVGALATGIGPLGAGLGGAAMIGGMAAESAGKHCGGAFSIEPIERYIALQRLVDLRSSN